MKQNLLLLLAVLAGVPLGLMAWERAIWDHLILAGAKVFTLTGPTQLG